MTNVLQEKTPNQTIFQPNTKMPETKRQNIVNRDFAETQPHDIRLPTSARTAQPHDIPFPPSRSRAPTAYTAQSPPSVSSRPHHKANGDISDFAARHPLPPSRGTTVLGTPRAATVVVSFDHRPCGLHADM